jgi:acyl-CoA reductase-like NAD-dependent aldehyde dehydrogenase
VGLELGNNAPVIIEADSDWQAAVAKIRVAGFSHAGQSCISTQRIYLQKWIADDFLERFMPKVEALVVGDPTDEATDVGPVVDDGARDRII